MMEAAPTVTARSEAICGSSESADRTIDWLANPATASNTMARVWDGTGSEGEGASTGVPLRRSGALYSRAQARSPHVVAPATHAGRAYAVGDIDSQRAAGLCVAHTKAIESTMIDNRYQPADIVARIGTAWEDAQAFRAGRPDRLAAAPHFIVISPPEVTRPPPTGTHP